ncbi:metallophosphoesterase [Brevibacillus sp. HB1.4B]|uniref:metallophosphoesterase n=1 Tax=Brevibacillus sp. HB1.4B TaxID=2738845 RepID=UPI00156B7BCD|nr:metallophosphoesterase [Brevibacillus sp. HB1.4B]NRS17694.1 metallophosphoesterase [Brevibacillus sp. HB1.4B]
MMTTIVLCILMGMIFLAYHTTYVKATTVKLTLPGVSPLTLIHLSDLHGRTRFWNGELHKLVNAYDPDIVIVTGDLTQHSGQLTRVLNELAKIKSEDGIFFVPGNYEREAGRFRKKAYSAAGFHSRKEAWQQVMTVLENESTVIEKDSSRIWIYGFDNSIYGNEQRPRQEIQQANLTIFLAHSPNIISLIHSESLKADLLLTGHTHGGQVRLFNRTIGAYKHFHVGQKEDQSVGVFGISRGLGTSRLPVRLNCFPEITVYAINRS